MRFYGMSFDEALSLSPKRFFFLCRNLERVRSDEAIWELRNLGAVTSSDGFKDTMDSYVRTLGDIVTYAPTTNHLNADEIENGIDPEYDRSKLLSLKTSFGGALASA